MIVNPPTIEVGKSSPPPGDSQSYSMNASTISSLSSSSSSSSSIIPPSVAIPSPSPIASSSPLPSLHSLSPPPSTVSISSLPSSSSIVSDASPSFSIPFTEQPPLKLTSTTSQRQLYDQLADLFSLLVTLEHLEHAYVRDALTAQDYTAQCQKLLAQYRTLREALERDVPDMDRFMADFSLSVPAAQNRIRLGIPATVVHGDVGDAGQDKGKELAVFHCVQHFITAMDSLKLGMKAVDELHPHINDLMDSIQKVPNLPNDHTAKVKVREWLTKLINRKAHEELNEQEQRQMSFDLDTAYSAFHKFIQGK